MHQSDDYQILLFSKVLKLYELEFKVQWAVFVNESARSTKKKVLFLNEDLYNPLKDALILWVLQFDWFLNENIFSQTQLKKIKKLGDF